MKSKIFIGILLAAMSSCTTYYGWDDFWGDGVDVDVELTGVYVAGYEDNRAVLWKDGVAEYPVSNGNSRATSVFVSDSNVYVAGYEYEGENSSYSDPSPRRAVVWKNGVAHYLTDRTVRSAAYSVFVSNGDVYVAGGVYENNDFYSGRAVVWKNGVAQYLTDEAVRWSTATSVFISDSDVYVAGSGTLWKNGVKQSGTYGGGTSVFVSGNDVYVVVSNTLWKNGTAQRLTAERSMATSVFVSDGDVYVVGYDEPSRDSKYSSAFVWKNNKMLRLTDVRQRTLARANAVFVVGKSCFCYERCECKNN